MDPKSGDFGYFGDYKMWRRNMNDMPGALLQQVHDVGCERDRADNRTLHMDQY
jgi:hypothetical protein